MKHVVLFAGVLAATAGLAQEATPKEPTDGPAVPSAPIANCAADFRERGRPAEKPVHPEHVADLRTALEIDLEGIQPDGLAGFSSVEPICFYWLPDGRILMRDGRGFEFYFREIPRWIPDRIDIPAQPSPE